MDAFIKNMLAASFSSEAFFFIYNSNGAAVVYLNVFALPSCQLADLESKLH